MGLRPAEDLENVTGRNATWMDRMDYILDIQWGLYIYTYIRIHIYIHIHSYIRDIDDIETQPSQRVNT